MLSQPDFVLDVIRKAATAVIENRKLVRIRCRRHTLWQRSRNPRAWSSERGKFAGNPIRMKALETIYSLILGPPTSNEGSRRGPISLLNVFNYSREAKLRFSAIFCVHFPYCSQIAPKCSSRKIHVCKLKKSQELVGAPGFELGTSCAQGKSRNAK